MVATYTASKMLSGVQPRMLADAGGVKVISTISLTVALALNDIINFVALQGDPSNPNGYGPTIYDVILDSDDLDSNGAPLITLDVGDVTVTTRYFSASTLAQAGGKGASSRAGVTGFQPFLTAYTTYTTVSQQTYTIFLTVHAAPATWQNGSMRLGVEYTYDP